MGLSGLRFGILGLMALASLFAHPERAAALAERVATSPERIPQVLLTGGLDLTLMIFRVPSIIVRGQFGAKEEAEPEDQQRPTRSSTLVMDDALDAGIRSKYIHQLLPA